MTRLSRDHSRDTTDHGITQRVYPYGRHVYARDIPTSFSISPNLELISARQRWHLRITYDRGRAAEAAGSAALVRAKNVRECHPDLVESGDVMQIHSALPKCSNSMNIRTGHAI